MVARTSSGSWPAASRATGSSCDVGDDLPELWADPDKIDQVLGNLLENAVRHGEGTVTIEVDGGRDATAPAARRPGRVTVADEGPGIPEEHLGRVFTRFWRGSKRGGTGLGLYIVEGIVEAHGGTSRRPRPRRRRRVPIYAARRAPRPTRLTA